MLDQVVQGPADNDGQGDTGRVPFQKVNAAIVQVNANTTAIAGLTTTQGSQATSITTLNTLTAATAATVVLHNYMLGATTPLWVTPASFGTLDPTGATDMTSIFQACINYACANKLGVRIPPGRYLINGTLFLYRTGTGGSFGGNSVYDSCSFVGAGADNDGNGATGANYAALTTLISGSTANPTICVDIARGFRIEGICFYGTGASFLTSQFSDNQSSYCGSGRNAQNSPYCAIAIDGLNSAVPSDATGTGALNTGGVNGWPALTNYYWGSAPPDGSSSGVIKDVRIERYVVGVALNPSGFGSHTDNIKCERVYTKWCDTGFIIGAAQNKIITLDKCVSYYCRQFLDCNNYGVGLNGIPPVIYRPYLQATYRFAQIGGGNGSLQVDGLYAEGVGTLGIFGTSPTSRRSSVSWLGCQIQYAINGFQTGYLEAPCFVESYLPMTFVGGEIYYTGTGATPANGTMNMVAWGPPIRFIGTSLPGSGNKYQFPFIGIGSKNNISARFDDIWFNTGGQEVPYSDDQVRQNFLYGFTGRLFCGPNTARVPDPSVSYPSGALEYIPPSGFGMGGRFSITGCSGFSISGTTLTYTTTNYQQVFVGDIQDWLMVASLNCTQQTIVPAWQVTNVNSGTGVVTCTAIKDTSFYDTVANYNSSVSTNTMTTIVNQWAPTAAITYSCTGATTSITTSTANCLQNGDWVQGTGLSAGTRIVSGANSLSGSGGTTSLTLNQATSGTQTAQNLYLGRLYAHTITAAF